MKKISIALLLLFLGSGLIAQEVRSWTRKEAAVWYNDLKWLNGLKLKPSNTIDQVVFAEEYHAREDWWKKAFAFMQDRNNDTLSPGTYPIDGDNVFAKVSIAPGKAIADAKWEAHKHYHDIHYLAGGSEQIGIGLLAGAKQVVPYEAARDISFFDGKGKFYPMHMGEFFILSPHQTHMPGIKLDSNSPIKKIVIKVRRAE